MGATAKRRETAAMVMAALLLTACGGGGGGGGSAIRPDGSAGDDKSDAAAPSATTPVSSDGSGVLVAVLDSGVRASHSEFEHGARVATGYNVADANADTSDMDSNSHGTRVASLAVGGTVGVAPGATLLPVRIIGNDGTFTTSEIAAGIDYARSRAASVNNISATMYDTASIRQALESSAGAGILTVVAAGNGGNAEPIPAPLLRNLSADAATHVLVVGAVDDRDQITAWSDRAGSAMNRYLVAPGVGVWAALRSGDDQYGHASGTSFSTPQVAGAAALVKGADPALTMDAVAQILLRSADDLGAPGVDAVYGWGKLNPSRALAPMGTLAIPDTEQAGGSAVPVSTTALRLGPAFGDALQDTPQLARVVALDDYRRPYLVDARSAVTAPTSGLALDERVAAAARQQRRIDGQWGDMRLGLTWQLEPVWGSDDPHGWVDEDSEPFERALLLEGRVARLGWQYSNGVAPVSRFGVGALRASQQVPWLLGNGPVDGYLSLLDTDTAGLAFGAMRPDGMQWRVGLFESRNGLVDDERPVRAGVAEAGFGMGRLQLRLTASQIHEQSAILGSAGDGALATGRRALTDSFGIAGQWRLGAHSSLLAHYQAGRTQVAADRGGLLRDWSTIYSSAWGIGAVRQGIFRRDDFLGLSYRRPLRAYSGSVLVDAPTRRDLAYRIARERGRASLRPSGAEQNLELAYGFGFGDNQISAGLIYRWEPGHVRPADPDFGAMVGVRRRF